MWTPTSVVTVIGREGNRVDGRLFCGFCMTNYEPISWYPSSPDQDMPFKLYLDHFAGCAARGGDQTVELGYFNDDGSEPQQLTFKLPS